MNLQYKTNLFKRDLVNRIPELSRILSFNYGLIKDEEDDRDYVMGAESKLDWKVLNESGDWTHEAKSIVAEVQKGKRVETMGCTGYALMNILEMIAFRKWDKVWNLSDRYVNRMSNTTPRGNSMRRVLETVRKFGVVDEKDWSWNRDTFTWNDYYKYPTAKVIDKGKSWVKEYQLGYDSVWTTPKMIKEALKYSPLYVAGYAWYKKGNLYYSAGNPNHCFTVIKYNSNEATFDAIAYDSYNPYFKLLDSSYKLFYVKRIYLDTKEYKFNVPEVEALQAKGWKYIMLAERNGEVFAIENGKLIKVDEQEIKDAKIKDWVKSKDIIGISNEYFNKLIK